MWGRTRDIKVIREAFNALNAEEQAKYGQLKRDIQTHETRVQEDEDCIQGRERFWLERSDEHQREDQARIDERAKYWSDRGESQNTEDAAIKAKRTQYWDSTPIFTSILSLAIYPKQNLSTFNVCPHFKQSTRSIFVYYLTTEP